MMQKTRGLLHVPHLKTPFLVANEKSPTVKLWDESTRKNAQSSFIRTIPSALELNQISFRSRARRLTPLYRRWGITPRPEDNYLIDNIITPQRGCVNLFADILSVYFDLQSH